MGFREKKNVVARSGGAFIQRFRCDKCNFHLWKKTKEEPKKKKKKEKNMKKLGNVYDWIAARENFSEDES